ncbi:hypothetical protein HDU81_002226 [Chytriomyces hyalinus]|nr:hypothetical protein HDU81_002226 [Chytriomyces hyalinus]
MQLIQSVLFVQDGKPALSDQSRNGAIGTAGSVLKGHVYVCVGGSIKDVKVSCPLHGPPSTGCTSVLVQLHGSWTAAWRPRKPLYNANGVLLTPAVDGAMEASKEVASLSLSVYQGSLLRGEHGLPVVLQLPASLPPSISTPTATAVTTSSNVLSPAVPITAKCAYELNVTVSASTFTNDTEERVFNLPVTVMAPSGLRAAYIRNQPRPLIYSNRLNLLVPGTISQDNASISPFSFALNDPLDPSIRTAQTSAQPIPIKDSGKLLYDLDVARLHHYIGDVIPITMAIKPTSIEHQIHSVTVSLITHIHFHLPKNLAIYKRPPSSAIAVRLATQRFDWGTEGSGFTRRFNFEVPESVASCPTMPDTPQNRLPFACLHMLRISVRVMNTAQGDPLGRLEMPQPVSAVRVSPMDSLVLDVPVVLVAKGDGIHLWGVPRAPRGWRLSKFVSTTAVMDAKGASKQSGQTVSVQGAKKNPASKKTSENQIQNRKSGSGYFGRFFGGVTPSLQQHPKYSADELNKMAREAMAADFVEDDAAGHSHQSFSGEGPSTNDSSHQSMDRPISPPLSPISSTCVGTIQSAGTIEMVDLPLAANENGSSIGVKEADAGIPSQLHSMQSENQEATSSAWEFQPELDDTFEETTNQDEQGEMNSDLLGSRGNSDCEEASATEATKVSITNKSEMGPSNSPAFEFHSKPLEPSVAAKRAFVAHAEKALPKIDQFARELEHGIDAEGRFLPSHDFSGWYRVLYPYLDNLREDEVRLVVGDTVRVTVSYVDGWAKGKNETSGDEGFLPLHCLISERNAIVEDGRALGKWFHQAVSHEAELPNDFKFLCHHETRYKLVKSLVTSQSPAMPQIEMPPSAHINLRQKRATSSWVDAEKCVHCYSQAAPEVWK